MSYPIIVYLLLAVTILGWGVWGFLSKLGIGIVGTYVNMFIIYFTGWVTVAVMGFFTMSHGSFNLNKGFIYPIIAGVAMGAGTVTYFLLIEKYAVSLILPLTLLYLSVALVLSIVFLHERLKLIHILGIILMITASLFLSQ